MKIRKCKYCGAEFVPYIAGEKFCSDECFEKAHTKTCIVCGKKFIAVNYTQNCCSPECGHKAVSLNLKRKRRPAVRKNDKRIISCHKENWSDNMLEIERISSEAISNKSTYGKVVAENYEKGIM